MRNIYKFSDVFLPFLSFACFFFIFFSSSCFIVFSFGGWNESSMKHTHILIQMESHLGLRCTHAWQKRRRVITKQNLEQNCESINGMILYIHIRLLFFSTSRHIVHLFKCVCFFGSCTFGLLIFIYLFVCWYSDCVCRNEFPFFFSSVFPFCFCRSKNRESI